MKVVSAVQKLIRHDAQTHRQHGDRISLLSYFKIRKVGKKNVSKTGPPPK
jgi:hypothetical protein